MKHTFFTATGRIGWIISLCLTVASAWAQTPATPPAHTDTALQGKLLQAVQKTNQADCQAACAANAACTGFTLQVPGFAREPSKSNCALHTGNLAETPSPGSVSCRMPCLLPKALGLPSKGLLLNKAQPTLQLQASTVRPTPLLGKLVTDVAPVPIAAPPAPVRPAVAPTPQLRGVSGYEIVVGPLIDVAPLSSAETSAQCPVGKVALSAGVDFTATGNASFGLEVRGAWPIDRLATVHLRNANVFEAGKARAMAVCIDAIVGLRNSLFDSGTPGQADSPTTRTGSCTTGEYLIGGGVMGREDTVIASNGPRIDSAGAGLWQVSSVRASPVSLPGTVGVGARIVCAPQALSDGWEYVVTPEVLLGARSQASLNLACPAGKVMLAVGVLEQSPNALDIVVNSVIPDANGTASAHLHNRNTLGTAGSVKAVLAGLCARRQ